MFSVSSTESKLIVFFYDNKLLGYLTYICNLEWSQEQEEGL